MLTTDSNFVRRFVLSSLQNHLDKEFTQLTALKTSNNHPCSESGSEGCPAQSIATLTAQTLDLASKLLSNLPFRGNYFEVCTLISQFFDKQNCGDLVTVNSKQSVAAL